MGARRHRRSDRAAITPFAVIISASLFLMAGLVHDGGLILAERREVGSAATAAARVASRELDEAALRDNVIAIASDRAAEAVGAYLTRSGVEGNIVSIAGATVTVEARSTVDLRFLGVIGLDSRDVSARGTARATRGITEADQ